MKNLKFLLVLSLAITLFSCGSDDSNNVVVSPNADLLGTWNATSITGSITGTAETSGVIVPITGTVMGSNINYSITFTEDPNNLSTQGTADLAFQASAAGIVVVDQSLEGGSFLEGASTWSRSGSAISITDDGEVETVAVSFSGNTMTLTQTLIDSYEENETTVMTTYTIISGYTKQ